MKNVKIFIVLICATFNVAHAQRLSTPTLNNSNDKTFIVTFKSDQTKRTSNERQLRAVKSRSEVAAITSRMSTDFNREISGKMQKLKIDQSKIKGQFASLNTVTMTLNEKEVKALQGNPDIESIEADQFIEVDIPTPEPNGDKGSQRNSNNRSSTDSYGPFNINAGGHKPGGANKSTWIWIVDTGIDLDHPDLNVLTNAQYAKSFVPGLPSLDDCNGHGTHVAGIAAAKENNQGIIGISEGATVVPIRIMDCSNGYNTATLVAALDHIATGVIAGDVVNMSIGCRSRCPLPIAVKAALDVLNARGVYTVMAAGNSNDIAAEYSPAAYNNTLAVTIASMDANGGMSWFSNYRRDAVDYIATGGEVYSTFKNGTYATMSGTSMAAPVVAGILHARGDMPITNGFTSSRGENYPRASLKLPDGNLTCVNKGAYVAKYNVSYTLDGSSQTFDSGNVLALQSKSFIIPAEATNVKIVGQGATGLVWEPWRTHLDKTFTASVSKTFESHGTTLNQWHQEI